MKKTKNFIRLDSKRLPSCASILVSHGLTLKDVQEWLGHSDITLTANLYGHLDIKRKEKIADTMASLIKS